MSKDFETFVKGELRRLGIKYWETKKDFVINCIRGHDRKTPSLGIRKRDGVCHCFGCGESWSWNKFAQEIDATLLDSEKSDKFFGNPFSLLRDEQEELDIKRESIKEPPVLEPWYGEWRGFSEEFLKSIPTYLWWDPNSWKYGGQVYRAYWKVLMNGKVKGYVSRRLDQEKNTKYRNSSGMSSLTSIFPLDFCPNSRCIVIVEGPIDALRLLYHGIPSLAVLGTNNWAPETQNLLMAKGAKYVIIIGDGDTAGKQFTERVYYDLLDNFIPSVFECEDGEDPDSMEVSRLQYLKAIVDSYRVNI